MQYAQKSFNIDAFKALENERPGTFEALVSVFDVIDNEDEVVIKGAFENIQEATPVVWSHQWLTPPIGVTIKAEELEKGLKVKGRLFVDGDDSVDLAKSVWIALKSGALKQWSFSGPILQERYEERDGRNVRVLEKLDLREYGPCLKGINKEAMTLSVKAEIDNAIKTETEKEPEVVVETKQVEETPTSGVMTQEQKAAIVAVML